MVDAATGGRSVLGRGIEKVNLGVPQGPLEFLNFDSVEISRMDDEQASQAITGNDGRDRGTPADIKFADKLKYALTPSRVLFDLVTAFGKPTASDGLKFKISLLGPTADPGADYEVGDALVFSGGVGHGAAGHVSEVDGGGGIIAVILDSGGMDYVTGDTVTYTVTSVAGTGAGTGTTALSAYSWLVKIRPGRTNEMRAASLYLFEGGAYTATLQMGRRAAMIQLADAANKRTEVDVTYSDPTGDTISGFALGASTNGAFAGKVSSRGRRPYDSNYDDGKSLYVKVTAATADKVTLVAKYDDKSVLGDGTDFPAGAYDTATFEVPIAGTDSTGADHDGYGIVVKDEGTVGLFGENFEAFELTFGSDLTDLAVDDEFEIPAICPALTKSVNIESRLSAFHLIRKLGGTTDVRIDKGTCKIARPYKAYRANGRRIPQAIDPTGDVDATWNFSKRLFDRYFRQRADAHARFTIYDKYSIENGAESVEIYAGQCAVTGMKSGDISSKNVLEETITLEAEEPESAGSPPTGFEGTHAIEINVQTTVDPTWLS